MARDVSSVTVYGNGCQVDLTLPNTAPLAELTPAVAALCGCQVADAMPATWALARVGQAPLPLSASLDSSGVLDGESLHLVDTSAWGLPRVVRIEDAVVAGVDAGSSWRDGSQTTLLAGTGAALLGGGALTALLVDRLAVPDAPALLACAAALFAAAYVMPGLARPLQVAACVGAWILAGAAGAGFAGGALAPSTFIAGALGVALAVIASSSILPVAVPGAGVACASVGVAGALIGAGVSPVRVGVVAAVAGALALRVVPTIMSGGLSRRSPTAEFGEMIELSRHSRGLLISMVAGGVAVVVAGSATLLWAGSPWTVGLALVMAASLGLRAADFLYVSEALAPALGAGIIVLGAELGAGLRFLPAHGRPELGPVVLIVSGLLVLATAGVGHRPRAEHNRSGVSAWTIVDACTVPLVLGSLGVLQGITHAVHGMFA